MSDYQRGVLALRMKPIIEARALARQQGGQGGVLLSPISDEATPDIFTSEVQMVAPVEPAAPAIRTDAAVASLASGGQAVANTFTAAHAPGRQSRNSCFAFKLVHPHARDLGGHKTLRNPLVGFRQKWQLGIGGKT